MNIFAGDKHMSSDAIGHEHGHEHDDDAEERSERWLISYADLITTLMVFFLALYVLELARYRELESKTLEARVVQHVDGSASSAGSVGDGPRQTAQKTLHALLSPLGENRQIAMKDTSQGVEIAINAKLLFNSGDAQLLPNSFGVLSDIAQVLATHSARNILVEGHSDSVPISNAKFASNWELSSTRAGAVVRFLVDKGVAPHRLSAVGRADNDPLMLGNDEAARAANRRVTILVQY